MSRLHLFFPENDLALAHGSANFTAPAAAIKLHRAGEILPLWYSDNDDRIITSGINATWLDRMRKLFNIEATVYDHIPSTAYLPYPWGWSAASRQVFRTFGIDDAQLPDDERLNILRNLSHRRTATKVTKLAQSLLDFDIAPAAIELSDLAQLESMLTDDCPLLLKSPWSSSGRGLINTRNNSADTVLRQAAGIIRRQGSIMVEREWEKQTDFALLYDCDGHGAADYVGLSLFETNDRGAYIGNALAAPATLHERLSAQYPRLQSLIDTFTKALSQEVAQHYTGPVGVDMMLIKSPAYPESVIAAVCEVNLRMTMGRVAHEFAVRHLATGSVGTYQVLPTALCSQEEQCPEIFNAKIVSGSIDLTPNNANFTFRVSVTHQ